MHHLLFCMCKPGVYVNKWRVYSSIVSFEYACILKSGLHLPMGNTLGISKFGKGGCFGNHSSFHIYSYLGE